MVADEALDRLAPMEEARHLQQREARQGDGHHRRLEVRVAVVRGEPVEGAQMAPATQEAQAHVPSGREGLAER